MNQFLLGWVMVMASALFWPRLLTHPELILLLLVSILTVRRWPLVGGALLAVCWFSFHASSQVKQSDALVEGVYTFEARLLSLVDSEALYQRTDWRVESVGEQSQKFHLPKHLKLSIDSQVDWQLGQRFRLTARLQRPSTTLNQYGFNGWRHALSKGIGAKGQIIAAQRLSAEVGWRQPLAQQLLTATSELPQGDLLRALAMADRRGIDSERWQQLRAAGLSHLIAISGLHLGTIAMLTLVVGGWACRLTPFGQGGRSWAWVLLLSAVAVSAYAALAGLSIATQRALVMTLAGLALVASGRFSRPWELLLRACALLLLWQPLAVLSPGIWLSAGAVASILLLLWAKPTWVQGPVLTLVWIQLGLTLTLSLVQQAWFGSVTLHGLWANLLMVPWVTLVALPLTLLSSLLLWLTPSGLGLSEWLLWLADWSLWPVAKVAAVAANLPGAQLVLPIAIGALMLVPVALWLIWRRPLGGAVWLGAALLLPSLISLLPEAPQRWRVHVLDVRQGLSVVVERGAKALIYDTGAGFPSGFNYVDAVVAPFIKGRGITQVEWLVVSHGDNDHAGGKEAAIRQWPDIKLIEGQGCLSAPQRWQGLDLRWQKSPLKGNNGSCVLRISGAHHSILLPGDIERAAEKQLQFEPATVLVSPHHGSRSSSSGRWVAKVSPQAVVHPAGRGNRWQFPHPQVVARYQKVGAKQWTTGQQGQVSFTFGQPQWQGQSYSEHLAPYWYNRLNW
ncbi:DNA internalization-related competence protein ComEC/Rec2 [Ferrimonas aestuarii]|uniref:DNA internalization-related competence protein ComEC/Rec2 n=1 Tax=Ferrimonas aestuarii TaxID=2569539 RepID=A0A4U1BTL6_9GAMM|nr:DNA internalization-related competence protein ComEC/Rec2 [Ferrimonas aestuarii]TKB58532.1 DNA internalization-related competence protein ComEC/Rec2 [Ferrimonas aestuarii]